MLDLQRQKYASKTNPGTVFARAVVIAHLTCGPVAAVAMLFHEQFMMAVIAALWFLITLGLVAGMKHHQQWCRVLLALVFELAAFGGFGYLVWVAPSIIAGPAPALSLKIMPFWLSIWALIYIAGGGVLLMSKRIKRATMRGFDLWPPPSR